MKKAIIIISIVLVKTSFSQTVIKLTHEDGPQHDYKFVNPKDTAFVFVYRDEDMGQWTNPAYNLQLDYVNGGYKIPDGEYQVYINGKINQQAFIKNKLPDSTWTLYYADGRVWESKNYKDGKLQGTSSYYFTDGQIGAISIFEKGVLVSDIAYYQSGCVWYQQTLEGDIMRKREFPDTCNVQIKKTKEKPHYKKSTWDSPDGKLCFNLSYSNQIQSVLEIGLSRVHRITTGTKHIDEWQERPYIKDYWLSGGSLNFVLTDHFVFAPKIFTTISFKWISAQLNLSAYTDFKNIEPVFTPEIGIGRAIGIRYGYNFCLLNKSFPEMGSHRLVIFINLLFPHLKHNMTY